jgi:lipopolysaccharide export system permease protein
VHRYESDQRDPAIVLFDQYAFDLSRLSSGPPTITFAVHERYITELYDALSQPLPAAQLGAIRAEIHNRITAPLYPVAFLVVTFAYLGAPRTTRQSRALSLVAAVAVVSLVRGLGFFGTLAGVQTPVALALPYATLALVVVAGSWSIARGVIIEPPAFIAQAFNAMVDAVMRRLAGAMGQTT